MFAAKPTFAAVVFSRRQILQGIGLLTFAAGLSSCSPIRYLLHSYPEKYRDREVLDATLRSFATTVIPGAAYDDENLVRIFTDEYYPFSDYAAFFANDLDSRTEQLFRTTNFNSLDSKRRIAVIQDGLDADATMIRMYKAAIYMTKVSYFAGIYDDKKGCPLIEFNGTNDGFAPEEMYYQNAKQYLSYEVTSTGNYQ